MVWKQSAFWLWTSLRSWSRNASGSAAVIAAVAGTVFLAFAVLAVDVGVAEFKRQQLQRALDSAVLSAAVASPVIETPSDQKAVETIVKNHVVNTLSFVPPGELSVTVTATSDPDSGVTNIAAQATRENEWLAAKLLPNVDGSKSIQVSSELTRPDNKPIELALVLDTTWSMSPGTKMADLKNAAGKLVDALMKKGAKVNIAVVPYTEYVNVGLSNRTASWLSVEDDSSTSTTSKQCKTEKQCLQSQTVDATKESCTGGCSGGSCVDSVCTPKVCTPKVCKSIPVKQTNCVKWGAPTESCEMVTKTITRKWSGCVGSRPHPLNLTDDKPTPLTTYPGLMNEDKCGQAITPLTDNKAIVTSAISSLKALNPHETYIPAGLTWGFATLTDDPPFTEAEPFSNKAVTKVLILMTDGDNTRSPAIHSQNPGKWGHEKGKKSSDKAAAKAAADVITADLCTNIKAQGINLYTVAFDVSNSDTLSMLTGCASGSSNAFSAANAAELTAAFEAIAASLSEVALVD